MEGWIKLHRSIKDNWIWQNSTYLRAWIIMLFTVNYEDKKVLIHGNIIECKRGQSLLSLDSWVDKFGLKKQCGSWTIQKVRTFFDLLERDQMITKETIHKTTRLTICNYNYYQDMQHDNNKKITRLQHDDNTIITQTKEEEEIKKERKEINIAFSAFWDLYDKKVGDKDKLIKKWESLTNEDRQKIIQYIPKYKLSQPDKKFRKDPQTFFNNHSWNDEIIAKVNGSELLDKYGNPRPSNQHCLVNKEWTVL